jgi:hypothetical protein
VGSPVSASSVPLLAVDQATAPVIVVGRLPVALVQLLARSSERHTPPEPTAAKSRLAAGSQANESMRPLLCTSPRPLTCG